jgi:hypothetical protein
MPHKTTPEVVELDTQELEAKLNQIEQVLGEETARPFRLLLFWYLKLLNIIQRKNTSISRLRQLLFGKKTERFSDLLEPEETPRDSRSDSEGDSTPETATDTANRPPPEAATSSSEPLPGESTPDSRPTLDDN